MISMLSEEAREAGGDVAHSEIVLFSLQLSTVFSEHIRVISESLRTEYGLSYNAATLMLALMDADASVLASELSDYLLLEKRTVLATMLELEDLRLLHKDVSSDDGRKMAVGLTDQGLEISKSVRVRLDGLVAENFWNALPKGEFQVLNQESIERGVDSLRGHKVENLGHPGKGHYKLSAGFLLYWRTLYDGWEQVVRQRGDLTFNGYRALALLADLGPMNPKGISERLLLQRSGVSICLRTLCERGLVRTAPDPSDGRGLIVVITADGRRLAEKLAAGMNELTEAAHSHLSDDAVRVVSAWYQRMYSNIMARRHQH